MSGGKAKTQERGAKARKRGGAGRGAGKGNKVARKAAKPHIEAEGAKVGGGRRGFPVFESLGQASAVLGAPEALIKAAKRQGCAAFISGSRVDAGVLVPFLFGMLSQESELPAGMASAQEWLTTERAKREAIKRKADEKKLMPILDAQQQASEACAFFFAELERAERELPPSLAGGTAVDIFKRLHNFTETLRKAGKTKFEVAA
jgi:hypothetical protein